MGRSRTGFGARRLQKFPGLVNGGRLLPISLRASGGSLGTRQIFTQNGRLAGISMALVCSLGS